MCLATRKCLFFILAVVYLAGFQATFGQGSSNNTGNGGINSARGRIYLPNGRTLEKPIKVELQSTTQPTQSVYSDTNGAFAFNGLLPGSYTIVVDAGDPFEIASESFYIDKEVQTSTVPVPPIPKNQYVPIHLRPKRAETLRNEILNAKWSAIPREAVQRYKKGIGFLQDGKDADAETEFRSSIAIAPNFAPPYTAIGILEVKAGKYEKAIESCKQAIRYDASDFDANLNLGIAFFNLNKMNEAELFFVNAAYINTLSIMPHYYLGLIFSAKNDGEVAQKAFEKVKQLDGGKSFPIIHKYLGRIYMHKQMNKEAVTEFETYLNLLPTAKDADAIRKDISTLKSQQISHYNAPT